MSDNESVTAREESRRRNALLQGLDQFADVVATLTGIRKWALDQGYDIKMHGRLKAHIVEAWQAAHPDAVYAPLMGDYHGASSTP